MTTVNPTVPIMPILPAATEVASREERQHQLPLNQIVRATVAEGGQEKVWLELQGERVQVETGVPLKTGQRLDLLVISTQPRLELQLIDDPLRARLGQALQALGRQIDVSDFFKEVSRQTVIVSELNEPSRQAIHNWLSAQHPAQGAGRDGSLGLLFRAVGLPVADPGKTVAEKTMQAALVELTAGIDKLDPGVAASLKQAMEHGFGAGEAARGGPEAGLRQFFALLAPFADQTAASASPATRESLATALLQFAGRLAEISPSLAKQPEQAAAALSMPPAFAAGPSPPVSPAQYLATAGAALEFLTATNQPPADQLARGLRSFADTLEKISPDTGRSFRQELDTVLGSVKESSAPLPRQAAEQVQQALARAMNDLTARSLASPPARELLQNAFTELATLLKGERPEIAPLVREAVDNWIAAQRDVVPNSGPDLRRMLISLGLTHEALLARGEIDQARTTLKAALLDIAARTRESSPETAEQAKNLLQGLELFQFCRLRLDEQNTTIFPLPFPFLEQGYLVAERRSAPESADNEEAATMLSMHLTLGRLGDLRIDFLHDHQGVRIRFLCDSPKKAAHLNASRHELQEALKDLPLLGLTFGTGAEDPARALLARILPEHRGVLDTRV